MTEPPARSISHFTRAVAFSPKEIKRRVGEVEGFNAKLAVIITSGVGTMACAYLFAAFTLISLPDKIKEGKKGIVEWVAQTFLQLVLLSIIMVGQKVQSAASDARAVKEFADTEAILDRLDVKTAGGLHDLLAAINELEGRLPGSADS